MRSAHSTPDSNQLGPPDRSYRSCNDFIRYMADDVLGRNTCSVTPVCCHYDHGEIGGR